MKKILTTILPLYLCSLNILYSQVYTFDFSIDDQGFVGGVSDFAVIQSEQHMFMFENKDLPSPFKPGIKAQYISGVNPSDDLFMYMKKKITGLQPNSIYDVAITVEFASIYPTNAIGVGGPPGEGVTMKAGVTLTEPDTLIIAKGGDFVAMNIDKGNQANPGTDMDTIGHVGVSDTTTVYTLKTNTNTTHPFRFITDATGEAWVIVGTDSGFESTTSLYFTNITYSFAILNAINAPGVYNTLIYPNPSSGEFHIESPSDKILSYSIWDDNGHLIRDVRDPGESFSLSLQNGNYWIVLKGRNNMTTKRLVVFNK